MVVRDSPNSTAESVSSRSLYVRDYLQWHFAFDRLLAGLRYLQLHKQGLIRPNQPLAYSLSTLRGIAARAVDAAADGKPHRPPSDHAAVAPQSAHLCGKTASELLSLSAPRVESNPGNFSRRKST